MAGRTFQVRAGEQEYGLEVLEHARETPEAPGALEAVVDGQRLRCTYRVLGPRDQVLELLLELDGRAHRLLLATDGPARLLAGLGAALRVEPARARRGVGAGREPPGEVTPPMPAVVVAVKVVVGQRVKAGEPAVVVSAMKMEATLTVPRDGVVTEVRAKVGDKVSPGDVLVRIGPDEAGGAGS